MASAPQPTLPLFYNDLMPLNSRDHGKWRSRGFESADFLKNAHAIPLTVDEFIEAQRDLPIIFSAGDDPLPLALMGLNEGINTYVNDQGKIDDPVYLPAYVRRYPFMLARLRPEAEELSLCFDPTSPAVGDFPEGEELFGTDAQPSDNTKRILEFCDNFEQAGQRTKAFIDELKKHDLLMEGEISIVVNENPDQPFTYRGFQMVNRDKLNEIAAEQLEIWNKNGFLMLVHAHLFSLDQMRKIFSRQVAQGKQPRIEDATPPPA
ncbi:SapC family protein [Qipengyuania sediminis]|uniref:SapC family protein n=1 Tax=Qipengyuania sediminis TaxID=1532023 RepID=UPI00105A72ED|nr:SapC family protein [Qipengyuania sediminis]